MEKRIKRKLVIRSLELDAKCIMLPIHLKTMDTIEETSTEAKVDTGKLSQPILVYNMDGTLNEAGSIREVVDMIMTYD